MLYLGLPACLLSLMLAAVYAANGSMILLCVSLVSLVIGTGFSIPAAVATEKEEEK